LNKYPAANPEVNITRFKIVIHTGTNLIAQMSPKTAATAIIIDIHFLFILIEING
jgi:hypothetical protein